MEKINFQDGTRTSRAKVTIDDVDYIVTPAEFSGATPLSAYIMNKLQTNVENSINQNADNIGGQEYDDTKTYDVGDIVKFEGRLYICQTTISMPEEFNPINWEETDVLSSAGGNEIAIGDEDTVTGKTKLWIEDDSIDSMFSEVVNSLEGNETTKAPSVKAVNDRFTYSTDEVKIGTWIDGKPLYRKTIQISSLPNATIGYVYHNISNFNELTNISAIEKKSNNEFLPIPFIGANNSALHTQISVTDTQIIIRTATNKSESSAIVTLEYTKTTD